MAGAIRKAVLPVAGLGTRFLPATSAVPKELLPVVDRPLIDYAIAEARAAGIERFVFITGREANAELLRNYFHMSGENRAAYVDRNPDLASVLDAAQLPDGSTNFVTQDKPLGLGHAIWCAREYIGDEPFAVILPDDLMDSEPPAIGQLIAVHENTGGNVVAVMDVPREATASYGIVDPGEVDGDRVEIRGLVEKPSPDKAPSTLSIIGRYVLLPGVFAELDRFEKGAGGEIQLTDAMARMIGAAPFHGFRVTGTRYDCGSKSGYVEAQVGLALKDETLRPDLLEFLRRQGAEWE